MKFSSVRANEGDIGAGSDSSLTLHLISKSKLKMSEDSSQWQTKNWCFTINNPVNDKVPETWPGAKFVAWQKEKGEGGTPHLQGYIIFKCNKRLSALKKIDSGAHWEPRRGTHDQALAYVRKEETRVDGPWQLGDEPAVGTKSGTRNDIHKLKRALDGGKTEEEIAYDDELFPCWAHNFKAIERYKRLKKANQRNWQTFTQVYWGSPGAGKSKRALEEGGPDAFWLRKPNGLGGALWWDGYDGQEVVVIDEFAHWATREFMCRLCDRYPLIVDTKGGAVQFVAKKIIITSNLHPDQWWPKIGLGAMKRRLEGDLGRIEQMFGPPQFIQEGASRPNDNVFSQMVAAQAENIETHRVHPYVGGREVMAANDLSALKETGKDLWCEEKLDASPGFIHFTPPDEFINPSLQNRMQN